MTILHLIRHGQASALADDYDQLQPLGEQQARLLGAHLAERGQRFDGVYVGPLRRQRETWRLMREAAGAWGQGWPVEQVLDGLAEGPFEVLMKVHLRPRIKVDARLQTLLAQSREGDETARMSAVQGMFDRMIELWRGGELSGDELEAAEAFTTRVLAAQDEIGRREGPERQVAVVTSNGVIGELLRSFAGHEGLGGGRLRFHNTSVSVIELHVDGARLHGHNLTPHLQAAHMTLL